ncbi:MAG: ABC transporter permease [Proteobacteria bacterium]|nr:ABC transporter permease [Pseudomonadota bacterium]
MEIIDTIVVILYATIHSSTPLLIAGLGELITEKSGILNLGVEGIMLIGAISGFIGAIQTDSILFGFICAAAGGMLMAVLFSFLVITLRCNQVASGLAITIFGVGLSAFMGLEYTGKPFTGLKNIDIPLLSDIPIIGKLIFQHDLVVYFSILLLVMIHYFLFKTRYGLILRAVGENHHAAHSMGYSVIFIRYCAVIFSGALIGIGGAYLSLVYTPLWVEDMTAGRGWIVLALVVFSMWQPKYLLLGAYLFGFMGISQLFVQGSDLQIPSQFLSMLPYLTTIIVLVIISSKGSRAALRAPGSFGQTYEPGS